MYSYKVQFMYMVHREVCAPRGSQFRHNQEEMEESDSQVNMENLLYVLRFSKKVNAGLFHLTPQRELRSPRHRECPSSSEMMQRH